jgi:2-dehydropantoate 2-reductase
MHVAVVGAGALGGLYGLRLATRAGVRVTFVVRTSRAFDTAPIVLERVAGGEREVLEHPVRADAVPNDADVVLLAVGTEDLDAVRTQLGAGGAPVVVLTPMMPQDFTRMRGVFGDRILAALPGVVSYVREDGVIRAWLPPRPTLIDEPRAGESAVVVHALASALRAAGLRAQLELGVHEKNPATTVCFIGIAMALAASGSVRAFVRDDALLELAVASCREGRELGLRIGRADPLATLGAAVVTPTALATSLRVLARVSPEAVHYAEHHFGKKLRAQHVVMAREIVQLAADKGVRVDAYAALAERLAATS